MNALERFKASPDDPDAQEALFLEYSALLYRLANRYAEQDAAIDAEDLVQEGFFALLEAARIYDPTRGKTFTSFCKWFVKRAYAQALHARYTIGEDGKQKMLIPPVPLSLDAPIGEDGEGTLGEMIADDTAIDPAESTILSDVRPVINKAVNELPERISQIIQKHYMDGKTLTETAKEMGMPFHEAYSAHGDALRRLRKKPSVRRLGADLDYYMPKSVAAFQRTQTSATEELAFRRIGGGQSEQ